MKNNVTAFFLGIAFIPIGASLVAAAVTDSDKSQREGTQLSTSHKRSSPLVDKVRRTTSRFRDINVATGEDWVPGTPCVSGPNAGAMGVHFLQMSRLRDGLLKVDEPEALIYEPLPGGAFRLVGVEYIVVAEDWEKLHPKGGTPALEGHLTNYVGAPNRYGLPAFYELHVWAWEHNPDGSFADFNTRVSCEKQELP